MDAATLTYREAYARMGISRTTFFAMLRTGQFDHLRAPVPERLSLEKVDAYLAGRLPVRPRARGKVA